MKNSTASGISTQLQGDWTIAGIARQTKPLAEFSRGCRKTHGNVNIDCSGIENIDLCGFQLIYVWMQSLNAKGLHTKLVNLPNFVVETQRRLGLVPLFDPERTH